MSPRGILHPNYKLIAEFRYQIRRFLRFSEDTARAGGLEPQQYQLMLALKGMPADMRPRIGEVAQRLQIQHHSTVELVDRLARRGLIKRSRSDSDRREVMLELTPRGDKVVRRWLCATGRNTARWRPTWLSRPPLISGVVSANVPAPASLKIGAAPPSDHKVETAILAIASLSADEPAKPARRGTIGCTCGGFETAHPRGLKGRLKENDRAWDRGSSPPRCARCRRGRGGS